MKIEITSKIISVTDPIRERIASRFAKLERLQVPLINPHVIITKEPKGVKIEATAGVPNGSLFAQADHEDLYAAINLLGQKLERQLNKHQGKPLAQRTRVHAESLTIMEEEQDVLEPHFKVA